MLAAVAETLTRAGFAVVARAADGREAVEAIARERPDVAVLDVQMPKRNGIEVARAVATAAPQTAFVFYTAFGETVRTHIRKAMAKLDADTRTHAVATALRQSLIS
jgi:DNA-binding NarL/FixJ family response regulator